MTTRRIQAVGAHPTYVWSFLAFLVCNMFSGHTDALSLPVGPDRLFLASTLVLAAFDTNAPWKLLRFRWFHFLAAIVTIAVAINALAIGTLNSSDGFYAWLDRIAVPYLLFIIAPVLFSREADRVLLLRLLTLMGIYLGVTAVFEIIGPQSLVFPSYITDSNLGIQYGRARGPFLASESNGIVLLICGVAATALRQVSGPGWTRATTACQFLSITGAALTLTRSVWLAAAIGLLVMFVQQPQARRSIGYTAAGLVIAGGLAAAASPSITAQFTSRGEESRSVYDRQNTNAAAVRAIAAEPLFGVGWSHFKAVTPEFVRQADDIPLNNTNIEVHNVVLSRAVELGLPISGLWVASVGLGPIAACRRGSRRAQRPDLWRGMALAVLVIWAIPAMLSPVSYPLASNLLWTLTALTARNRQSALRQLPRLDADGRHPNGAALRTEPNA